MTTAADIAEAREAWQAWIDEPEELIAEYARLWDEAARVRAELASMGWYPNSYLGNPREWERVEG